MCMCVRVCVCVCMVLVNVSGPIKSFYERIPFQKMVSYSVRSRARLMGNASLSEGYCSQAHMQPHEWNILSTAEETTHSLFMCVIRFIHCERRCDEDPCCRGFGFIRDNKSISNHGNKYNHVQTFTDGKLFYPDTCVCVCQMCCVCLWSVLEFRPAVRKIPAPGELKTAVHLCRPAQNHWAGTKSQVINTNSHIMHCTKWKQWLTGFFVFSQSVEFSFCSVSRVHSENTC